MLKQKGGNKMESAVTKKEMFETIKYVVNMMERGKDNLTLEIKNNCIKIEEKKVSSDGISIDKFTYEEMSDGDFKEILETIKE